MGISTNGLNLSRSITAQDSFQARTPGSGGGQVADDPKTDAEPGSQANGSSSSASRKPGGDSGSSSGSGRPSSGSSATGPTAQTRNGQAAQSGNSARTARARSNSTTATGSSATTDAQDPADSSTTDFGTVMANALGRGDSAASGQPSQAKDATDSDDTASGTTNAAGQQASPPTDAMAWIAQVMMPAAAHAATATTSIDVQDALAAGQAPAGTAGAIRARINADVLSSGATAATDESATQTASPSGDTPAAVGAATPDLTGGNLNALADVQKLISGLTDAIPDSNSDSDTGTVTAAPSTHSTAAAGGTDAAGMAAAEAASLSRPNTALGSTTLTIQSPVGSAAFTDEVSSRVSGLAQSGVTQAQLQLNPTDLGPVQVHITMQSGQASVWFGATHADTRAALEQSLPRLREMFAGAGMPLTDSGVFREPPQQQQARSAPASGSPAAAIGDTAAATTVTQVSNVRLSLLDTYA